MKYTANLLLLGTLFMSQLQSTSLKQTPTLVQEQPLFNSPIFEQKHNADYYWDALIQAANNNTQTAVAIVQALQTNAPLPAFVSVKDNYRTNVDTFFDYLFLKIFSQSPQALTSTQLFESIGVRDHNAYLDDVSPNAIINQYKERVACLEILKTYDRNKLTHEQKLSYDIFSWFLNHVAEGKKFLFHEYKINQMMGLLSDLSLLFTQQQPLGTPEDAEYYIVRLHKIPEQFNQIIELLEYQKDHGIVPPAFTLKKVIAILQKTIPAAITECVFYATFAKGIKNIDGIDRNALLQKVSTTITDRVYPAYQQLADYCTRMRSNTTANNGVWALPDGDEYYAHMLKFHTTTDLTADQIHEQGITEVAHIHAQMREIFATEGIIDANKTIGELFEQLNKSHCFYYPNTAEGKQQCLAQFEAILERCRKELYPLFDLRPKFPVKIQAIPVAEEDGAPAACYFGPSLNGSRPGIFFVNLRDTQELPTYQMETLAVHEGEPGHHFQVTLQNDMNIPTLRKPFEYLLLYNAYIEGWALYAEKLAYEHGFYSSSFAKLGHLQDELLRAARLVVDTGIHNKRWTREHAIEYMKAATGMHEGVVASEVERYFVLPGQACSYKIGQLKILELRQRVKDALDNKFSIQEFHNVVLTTGGCPLTILENVIDQYIQSKMRG